MTETATAREHVNAAQHAPYIPQHAPTRPGADDALALPSRIGDQLRYRDGRVERLGHRASRVCGCPECIRFFVDNDMEGVWTTEN